MYVTLRLRIGRTLVVNNHTLHTLISYTHIIIIIIIIKQEIL